METNSEELSRELAANLPIRIDAGESTLVSYAYTTGWRVLPSLVVSQMEFACRIELEGRTLRSKPGSAVILAPGVRHCLTATTRQATYSHWVHLQCNVFAGVSLFSLAEAPLVLTGRTAREIGKINRELGRTRVAPLSLAGVLRQQALGWQLISVLLAKASGRHSQLDRLRYSPRLTLVLGHVESRLAQPITHGELARIAGLSPSRFHHVFRTAFGCAPYEYVQRARLKKAQELLMRSDRTVAEIAGEVGHPDPYHFSRTFRRQVGVSPLHYRRQMAASAF